MTETKPKDYWISPTALKISLNALSDPDYMQASAASGAMIMCYMKGINGLEFDHGHNYKRWPLKISPTYFTTPTRKYVYVKIPRPTVDPADVDTDVAQVVFPSEHIDLYGMTDGGEQLGDVAYYYIYLQGIISGGEPTSDGLHRHWEQEINTGTLNSDEATEEGGTGEWWKYDPITDTVTFLKTIAYAVFDYLKAAQAEIHNLNVTGTFDAIKGYIDDIRSHNYQSGMLDGSGWRLTNDNGDGASELEVDMLKVRKKATFMELEIREETFVGGNQHYSPAGSVIYRVEYLDENDEALGYTVMKVPFLLKRFAFLGHFFNYAARKRIQRELTAEEWKKCHHFRCYLLADNGTTATRNWWKVGDQPRCQTFNKAISAENKRNNLYNWKKDHFNDDPSQPMPKYTTIEGPFETSYYWRLCTNVGSAILDDGHAYDFIDMPYEGWEVTDASGVTRRYSENEKASFRDGGSGIPVAGDTIVCMGNRTDQERMNMISLYTSGNDNNPPAIKGYRGIHTFSIEQANRVFEISPNEFLVRSRDFKLLDDAGYEFPVPIEKGEYTPGVRYHWYDRVSWAGCLWLCQVLDDYQWQDVAGNSYEAWRVENINYGEGDFEYTVSGLPGQEGSYTGTDHYYRTGTVSGTTVYYIKRFTYSEPSVNNDLWLREVNKGRAGIDGDGVEFVFIRTATNEAPYITNSSDTYQEKTYLDDDYLPLSSAGRCTDDPMGPTRALPFEWQAKRCMGDPDAEGNRTWNKYNERIGIAGGEMSLWATFSENAVRLDLDNENDTMLYSSSKGLISGNVTTTGTLFDGQSDVSSQATWSIQSASGCTATISGRTVTVTAMSAASGSVVVQAVYKGQTYTATLTLKKNVDEDKYDLVITPSSIAYNATTDTPATTVITVQVWRMSADGTRALAAPPSGYATYLLDGNTQLTYSAASSFTYTVDNSERGDITVKIAKGYTSDEYLDCETIPIAKSANGAPGGQGPQGPQGSQGKFQVVEYAISAYKTTATSTTMPYDCSESDWQSTAPLPSVYRPYVWKRSRIYDPATGSYTSWTYIRETGEKGTDGQNGKTGLWYRYAGVWGTDVDPSVGVTNTTTVGYYVREANGNNFWMNVKEANDPNTTTPGGTGWEAMTSVFEYFMTKATFADSAYLGSFIINHDWMISQYGGPSGKTYSDFNPSGFASYVAGNNPSYSGFIPNFAIDGLTGKTYQNDAHVKGEITADSGKIGKFNIQSDGSMSATSASLKLEGKGVGFDAALIVEGQTLFNALAVKANTYWRSSYPVSFLLATTGSITLPPIDKDGVNGVFPGTIIFVRSCYASGTTVYVNNTSNTRIAQANLNIRTYSDIGRSSAFYILVSGTVGIGDIDDGYVWCEFFCG